MNLAYHSLAREVCDAGGVAVTLGAIEKHPANAQVQLKACSAIINLTINLTTYWQCTLPDNIMRLLIVEATSFQAMLPLLLNHFIGHTLLHCGVYHSLILSHPQEEPSRKVVQGPQRTRLDIHIGLVLLHCIQ